jgi:intein/homing endonuclease/uncharacterized protein YbjQ (UPF0145 family)
MESRITNLASRLQDFTKLMSSTQDRPEDVKIQLESIEKTVEEEVREIDIRCEVLARSVNTMMNEWRLSRKKKPGVFNTAETADESWREDFAHSAEGMNFLNIAYNGAVAIRGLMHKFQEIMVETRPSTVFMPTNTPRRDSLDIEDMQRLHFLSQMNAPAVQAYADAMLGLDTMHKELAEAAETISNYLELYYRALVKRHTVDGVAIHRDAVLTDVAMHIYENIDAEGEIAMGRSPDELSAYSKRKARVMTEAIQDPFVHEIMTAEHGLISFLVDNLEMVSTSVTRTATLLRDESKKLRALIGGRVSLETNSHRSKYSRLMVNIRDLDPSAVSHKAKAGLQTHDEKFRDRFRDETMGHIVQMLVRQAPTEEIIPYVLERKEKIRRYFQEENSFYTCSIGAGNPFLGVAPGGIQISPSARPLASFDDIVGAGFPELKGFVRTIRGATLWHDLFAATSPSKSADKSNILMMGPQGCGKCVTGDTLVFTDGGLVRIDSLNPGVNDNGYGEKSVIVRSLHGMKESTQFYDSGVQPVIRVTSRSGFEVEGTDKHRLICSGDSGPEWRRLDEIRPGDYVAIVRKDLPFGYGPPMIEKAYSYGYYVGDGSTSGPSSRPRAIRFSVATEDLEDFKIRAYPYLESIGKPSAYADSRGNACFDVQVSGLGQEGVLAFREECGHGCVNKRVPPWVLSSGKETWKSFLQGLFDADGSTYGRRVELSSNSHGLLKTVQTMLLAFGVVSIVQNKESNPRCWRLFIYGENLRRFAYEVGFGLPRKSNKLIVECETVARNDNYDVIPVSRGLWSRLKTESGPLSREVHKSMDHYFREGHLPGRRVLNSILQSIPECDAKAAIVRLSNEDYQWDRVDDVSSEGLKPTYDLVVPDGESFAANGFMNHNTEAMRSIASEKDSIAIFAVGSDFKTCWKDEGLKNPKRLFEHAVRLQKDSQKHVHILIDEADSVMCKKEFLSQGDDDLTTEFQNLMDGIVQYPNITVWAATNHPERMPMPIIRRFSKVLVVGELTSEDRVFLLKRFFSYLPLEAFGEDDWRSISSQLDGATGDVIRKVVDTVWRSKMAWFTETMPEAAESVKGWLNRNGKFSVADMPPEDRTELIVRLGEHFRVTVREVRAAVEAHMKNVATRTEITSAKEVYANARAVVSSLSGGLIVTGGKLA